jgi:S1-C subfamily serine protease
MKSRFNLVLAAVVLSGNFLPISRAAEPRGLDQPAPRFIVDDEDYLERISHESHKLLRAGQLKTVAEFKKSVTNHFITLKTTPLAAQKMSPPDLCDRLRQSTFTIGSYYHCPDCDGWHVNTGAGFVIDSHGLISTCCHVVLDQDENVKEAYLVAADAQGKVYPVISVLAADTEADTCVIKIDADHLRPLALRPGVRVGEPVFCLSHPGGYHYMFTQGMIARINRHRDDVLDDKGRTNGLLTRPLLFVNVTAEYAPGSSGAAMVDEAGNVVAQVASITEASEGPALSEDTPGSKEEPTATFPSVPVRFCTSAEEIVRLISGPDVPAISGQPRALTTGRERHKRL